MGGFGTNYLVGKDRPFEKCNDPDQLHYCDRFALRCVFSLFVRSKWLYS